MGESQKSNVSRALFFFSKSKTFSWEIFSLSVKWVSSCFYFCKELGPYSV